MRHVLSTTYFTNRILRRPGQPCAENSMTRPIPLCGTICGRDFLRPREHARDHFSHGSAARKRNLYAYKCFGYNLWTMKLIA